MRSRSSGSSIAAHAAMSGSGFAAAQWDEHASNSAASSGKWRYTVERRTPARSAIALIDVRAGPTVPCSSTAVSRDAPARLRLELGAALLLVLSLFRRS